jgi:hypothetical protein
MRKCKCNVISSKITAAGSGLKIWKTFLNFLISKHGSAYKRWQFSLGVRLNYAMKACGRENIWVLSLTPTRLIPSGLKAGWAPETACKLWGREYSCTFQDSNSDPSIVQPIASHYNNRTIRCWAEGPIICHHKIWSLVFQLVLIVIKFWVTQDFNNNK